MVDAPENLKRHIKKNKALKDYYCNYYNNNFLRDFRFIFDDAEKYNHVLTSKKYGVFDNSKNKALKFLTNTTHNGLNGVLINELTFFKSFDDFKERNDNERYSDRLFFDFDIEDERVNSLKSDFKEAIDNLESVECGNKLDELRNEFQELIFDNDLLLSTFNEAQALCNYFKSQRDVEPYLIFSGSKGFHVNIFFDETKLMHISEVSYILAKMLKSKLNLSYLDLSVNRDAKKRSQRVQYKYHSKTGLLTTPIDYNMSYDEVLDCIQKPKIKTFNIDNYKASETFLNTLITLDNDMKLIERNNDEINRQKGIKRQNRISKAKMKYGSYLSNSSNINICDIVKYYGIDGKDVGDRIRVSCPFHNDKNPSAVFFKDSNYFHCSACNIALNYYDFVAKMEGLSDEEKIMEVVRNIVS